MLLSDNRSSRNAVFQISCLLFLIISFCVFNAYAQSGKSAKINFDTCETMMNGLFSVLIDFRENAKPDSNLVIIGGGIKGEKRSSNSWRIRQAVGYFEYRGDVKNDRIVFGTGTPEAEAAYLRFYINGVLFTEIRTRKNGKLCGSEGDILGFKGV